jgi:hypothetical protein
MLFRRRSPFVQVVGAIGVAATASGCIWRGNPPRPDDTEVFDSDSDDSDDSDASETDEPDTETSETDPADTDGT